MRTHYKNGDEVGLTACGCDGCSPSMVNGVLCHEQGCPDAWKDKMRKCLECGCSFYPTSREQLLCDPSCGVWEDIERW
jgi:hypothetical protein